ncbi:hypothetical protein TraAM80_02997 [Trypanosoma rangeli]|uniref:Starter acyltransferase (SAT) domain-containing protein n=1 Tax=Trypanosoma rangeli TaxID=5698 RepID=A0A422NRH7_TRYRA|nr:uncharacterized protein TraAM80_02997 [Trypanosoma rangeli]RNF08085.1 hypothetical protein TraAM80_02997 [Trypanosoma rangeli]|eukprot:RNF08085.1 hypothetical protein TraAM80_02997 [Trypanosoma rangeli]
MHACERDDPDHHPNEDRAPMSCGPAGSSDYRGQAMYGDPTSLDMMGLLPRGSLRADANACAADSSSGWRLFGLPIASSTLSGTASCHEMLRGPSVQRATESHTAIVTDFSNSVPCPLLTASVHEMTVGEPPLSDVTVLGDDVKASYWKQLAATNAEEKLDSTVSAHVAPCASPGVNVGRAPSQPPQSTAPEAVLSVLQCESVKASSMKSVEHDASKLSISDSHEENFLCLHDVLKGSALAMSSPSAEEVLQPQRTAPVPSTKATQRMDISRHRKHGLFGLFGLFGTMDRGYFEAFIRVFRRNQILLEGFLERVLQSKPDLYIAEIGILDILRLEQGAPDDQFFMDPLISWPTHVLYKVSCFYVTAKKCGYHNTFEAMRRQGGVFASGKGLFAALAVAMSPTEEELIHHTAQMCQAACIVGLVYSKFEKQLHVQVKQCALRSFSLVLANISTISLQLLLDEVNTLNFRPKSRDGGCGDNTSHGIPMSRLVLARVISSHSAIVCGHPLDLERLSTLLLRYADATGVLVQMEYLLTTVPENSPFYNTWQHLELLQLWKESAVELDAAKLQLTLYSPVDGQPWNEFTTCALADRVAVAVTYALQDLTCSLQHMRSGDVLLDFSAAAPCMSQLIAWTRKNITMLLQPADCVSSCIFPSPRRSPEDGVLCSTLAGCARINTIMQSMQWEGKPRQARVLDLTMNFVDLGLLVSAEELSKASAGPHLKCRAGERKLPRTSTIRSPQRGTLMDVVLGPGEDVELSAENDALFSALGVSSAAAAAMPKHYITLPHEKLPGVLDIYYESPAIRYYEMQCNCFLTRGAVEFTRRLSLCTGIALPPHTLLMCPTLLSLMELLDTYAFLRHKARYEE